MANNQQLLLGEGAGGGPANYIEDVFSTYLYTGNGSTQTITNNIDLSTKGGLVWLKSRSGADPHELTNTVQGTSNSLRSNSTNGASSTDLTGFTSSGFTLGYVTGNTNASGATEVSWTFRKQPKFFDVVTWTATGSEIVSHNLQSVPGCVIYKNTSGTSNWFVVSRKSDNSYAYALLNTTGTAGSVASPTAAGLASTTFDPSQIYGTVSGQTYVGYFFAHDAGGFGLSGTDNVISCGSYAGSGAAQDINLGYEPQWVLVKNATTAGWDWYIIDNMRGFVVTPASPNFTKSLSPNTSGAESDQTAISPTATGFRLNSGAGAFNGSGNTYIYIAIRRGPMKVPTVGTSVFSPVSQAGGGTVTTNFPVDLGINTKPSATFNKSVVDRLRGVSTTSYPYLLTETTAAEVAGSGYGFGFDNNIGYKDNAVYGSGETPIYWNFRRAPGFFDEVCYTGTYLAPQSHNLGVAPELVIFKNRTTGSMNWIVKSYSILGNSQALVLNSTAAAGIPSGLPTPPFASNPDSATTFYSQNTGVQEYNYATDNYVAYLFATCAGVSKVGTYTGNGSSQTIACGFAAGSRFVMIKRTDSTGDWYVWDSARGIVAGNDPHLSLNTTAAEVTTDDSVDTDNSGFIVNQLSATNVNVTSATYIFLAIA